MGMVLGMSARSPSPEDFTQLWLGTQMSFSAIALLGCWDRCDGIVAYHV